MALQDGKGKIKEGELSKKITDEINGKADGQDLINLTNDYETHKADNVHIPTGLISMWSGVDIPVGWALCDGQNGTPDLRDRFIVGAGSDYDIGDAGGEKEVTLTSDQMPSHSHARGTLSTGSAGSHSHSGSTSTDGAHTHGYSDTYIAVNSVSDYLANGDHAGPMTSTSKSTNSGGSHSHTISTNSTGSHSHTISGNTANSGSNQAHENRPPYFALAFIMKL